MRIVLHLIWVLVLLHDSLGLIARLPPQLSQRTSSGLALQAGIDTKSGAVPGEMSEGQMAACWKIVSYGATSANKQRSVEVKDRRYREVAKSVTLRRPLGLDLVEAMYDDTRDEGLVMVGDIVPGGNAAATGAFQVGDILVSVSAAQPESAQSPRTASLAGLPLDRALDVIGSFSDCDSVTICVKRLKQRNVVSVKVIGPDDEEVGTYNVLAGYGTNLRTVLQSQDVNVYDARTARFDAVGNTGNCGGDGTCGTCLVSVLLGKERLNERARVEDGALRKQLYPPNYRWACRTLVAPNESDTGVVKVKLRPQSSAIDNYR